MSEVNDIKVPASLLKLEALRLEKIKYFGLTRVLSERKRELHNQLREARRKSLELSEPHVRHAMGNEYLAEAVLINTTVIASVEAMLRMVDSELEELIPMERNAALFQEAYQLWLERMNGWMRDIA